MITPTTFQYSAEYWNVAEWMERDSMAGMIKKLKTAKQLERHFKGVANHWRIEILRLVGRSEGIRVEEIAATLNANMKTISEHTKKLTQAGLIDKRYQGRSVEHKLSPYGKIFMRFINSFQSTTF